MERDYIEVTRETESKKYAAWTGAEKTASPVAEATTREEANRLLDDIKSGLATGASKVLIDSGDKAALELVKKELTPEIAARVEFVDHR